MHTIIYNTVLQKYEIKSIYTICLLISKMALKLKIDYCTQCKLECVVKSKVSSININLYVLLPAFKLHFCLFLHNHFCIIIVPPFQFNPANMHNTMHFSAPQISETHCAIYPLPHT